MSVASPPRLAREWIVAIIVREGWASGDQVFELAERWEASFLSRLRQELSTAEEAGRFSYFEFNSSSTEMIQGSCFIEPADPPETQVAKNRRARLAEYVGAVADLTPAEFEAVCRGILKLLGVDAPALTPRTADEGVDFYGRLHLAKIGYGELRLPGFVSALSVWLIGQAKHYPAGQAATPEIRELVGSVQLARARAFSRAQGVYEDMEIRLCDPVFYLFFTTGTISAAGWRLLKSSGVVGMDGSMLATFLADHGVVGPDQDIDRDAFRAWLATV